jgi:hypothetical protein
MKITVKKALQALPAAAIVLGLGFGLAPAPALAYTHLPSYANKGGKSIKGRITGFDGKWIVFVRDKRGYIDNVTLHPGTIINPTGIQLQAGYPVTVYGFPRRGTFVANEIDTPFHYANIAYAPFAYAPVYPAYWGWQPFFGYEGWDGGDDEDGD